VIGATNEAQALLGAAGVVSDIGVVVGSNANAFVAVAAKGRIWEREPKVRTVY